MSWKVGDEITIETHWGKRKLGKVLDVFLGDDKFPIDWGDKPSYPWIFKDVNEEKKLFYMRSDTHHPLMLTPLQEDIFTCYDQSIIENPGRSALWAFDRYWLPEGIAWVIKRVGGRCYIAIVPPPDDMVPAREKFYNTIIGAYADHAVEIWERLKRKTKLNFEYIDSIDFGKLNIAETMIVFQDMLDIYSEHYQYHWYINTAYYALLTIFKKKWKEFLGEEADERIVGDLSISLNDANWDRLKYIHKFIKKIKESATLEKLFREKSAGIDILEALKHTSEGQSFLKEVLDFLKVYGWMSPYVHMLQVESFFERPEFFFDQLRYYFITDYDYNKDYAEAVERVERAKRDFLTKLEQKGLPSEHKNELLKWYERVLIMAPLNPDHNFYFDQGTQTRLGYICRQLGKKLVEAGILEDAADVFFLKYYELKTIVGDPKAFDAKKIVKERKMKLEKEFNETPYLGWFGTATEWALTKEFWRTYFGWDISNFRESQEKTREEIVPEIKIEGNRLKVIKGIATGTPTREGIAKLVLRTEDFRKIQKGDVAVAIMTSPAWGIILPKLAGLVTDSGTALSHPAINSRTFGIACVVGTRIGTKVIKEGQRVRVNGSNGTVEILS